MSSARFVHPTLIDGHLIISSLGLLQIKCALSISINHLCFKYVNTSSKMVRSHGKYIFNLL